MPMRYELQQTDPSLPLNKKAVERALMILGFLITGLFLSKSTGISNSLIALGGGILALLTCGFKSREILARLNYKYILFFSCVFIKDLCFFAGLFILVGAAENLGLLNWFGATFHFISFGNILIECLVLMWISALVTGFLNAGPSAVLFSHLLLNSNMPAPQSLYWWSLSLGVLAGSSATLSSVTTGIVASTMLKEGSGGTEKNHYFFEDFNMLFKRYPRIGIPLALFFLVIASIYVTLVYCYA